MAQYLGSKQVAELLGVSEQRVGELSREYEDFPHHVVNLRGGRDWTRQAIETWIRAHRGERLSHSRHDLSQLMTRLTSQAREVLEHAEIEARGLKHEWVGTEHVLMALFSEQGDKTLPLMSLEIKREDVLSFTQGWYSDKRWTTQHPHLALPITPRLYEVLKRASRRASELHHDLVDPKHILLSLIEEGGLASEALVNHGVDLLSLRERIDGSWGLC